MTDFQFLQLRSGAGKSYANGYCVMQAVAWLAGEDHTDAPECACPVLRNFAIRLNDRMTQDERDLLLRSLIVPLTGTRSLDHERMREEYIVRRIVREIVAPLFDDHWPEHGRALRRAETMADIQAASYAAHGAVFDVAAYAAYDAAAAAAALAAYSAAADAYVAHAEDATAYAAEADRALCADILRGAIMLGPNGLDAPPPALRDREQALREMVGAAP